MIEQLPDYLMYGAGVLALNQTVIPLMESIAFSTIYNSPNMLFYKTVGDKKVPKDEIKKYEGTLTDQKFDALDFVNIATGLTHNKSKLRGGVCRHYADTVYKTYKELTELNGRGDLKNNVSICINEDGDAGHAFLRVKTKSGETINYETFKRRKTPLLEPEEVNNFSTESFDKVQNLNLDKPPDVIFNPKYHVAYPTIHSLTKKGGSLFKVVNALKFSLPLIYKDIRNFKKEKTPKRKRQPDYNY